MTVIGVTTVRDEADIIETTIRHTLAEGVDRIIAWDCASVDGTGDLLDSLAEHLPVTVVHDDDPAHRQEQRITWMAHMAARQGATWVLPFDADEIWYSPHGVTLAAALASLPVQVDVVAAKGWDHIVTEGRTLAGLSPWRRRDTQPLPKVAFRASLAVEVARGNHSVTPAHRPVIGPLSYRHFQYRSLDHMTAKVRQGAEACRGLDLPDGADAHWHELDRLDNRGIAKQWEALRAAAGLVYDPAPLRLAAQPSTTIVIPTLGKADLLDQCLDALDRTAPGVAVVVMDDGSSDREADAIKKVCGEHAPTVTLARNEDNAGFAAACNDAPRLGLVGTDRICFLNNDTLAQPGWLEAMGRHPGIVGAHLVYPDGTTQHSGVYFRRDAQGRLEAFNRTVPAETGRVPAVTAACMLIDRADFEALGGFDEGYRNGYEDVDLCLRAWERGIPIHFEAGATVVHLESQTEGRFAHAADNVERLQKQWGHLEV